ncbi:MAG: sugar ABC transporter permease [Clostridia bacterium]|nr:sugar ABC transporter permease [Clostridia bacterium]
MMSPFLLMYLLMVIAPIAVAILFSFTSYDMFSPPEFVGLSNFVYLFVSDSVFIKSLANTLQFAVVTGPISFMLCFLLAWIINDLPPKLRAVITLVFYAPSISANAYVVWQYIFSPDAYGFANSWLMSMGLLDEPLLWFQDPAISLFLLMAVQLWLSLGVGFLSFIAGLQNVDRQLYEAAAIDGIHNRWEELWYVTLPSMKPMLIFGGLNQIVTAFTVGDISMTLCGFPSVQYAAHTVSLHAYDYGILRYEIGYSAAISLVLFVIVLFTYKLFSFAVSRIGR